jgi:hypothetical protein
MLVRQSRHYHGAQGAVDVQIVIRHLLWKGDTDIKQQRGEIVGRVAKHTVLSIDQANAAMALPVRQPEQVVDVKVTHDPNRMTLAPA